MIARTLLILAGMVIGTQGHAASLDDVECPYGEGGVPEGYQATCYSMGWSGQRTLYRTTIATFTPEGASPDTVPVIYIPGGPGDAPVNEGGDMAGIVALFPGRQVITLNPRGTEGTRPRPYCDFEPDFWQEDLPFDRERVIVEQCRDEISLDLTRFDSPYLARDISRLVKRLGIERAGIFSVSYGTESALHLLAEAPPWLSFAILDSVSLPGALGARERLAARDRFLGIVDQLCFAEKQCSPAVTDRYDDVLAWTAQFDSNPLEITVGPDETPWSLDAQDMLDFLASMSSYPDGAGYGPVFIEAFEDSRDGTGEWVASELERSVEYALENFVLLYGAFSDSPERDLPSPAAGSTRYPFNDQDYSEFTRLFQIWNAGDRTEERFIGPASQPTRVAIPVLVLSGEADTATPIDWALELDNRFTGLTHFVFPRLGHAVAFGSADDVKDQEVTKQLECGPSVVRAFTTGADYGDCLRYRRKTP
jgi:pimeloyl-ACP methyl ester carboxylesterase